MRIIIDAEFILLDDVIHAFGRPGEDPIADKYDATLNLLRAADSLLATKNLELTKRN
jgi:hypothetical protein